MPFTAIFSTRLHQAKDVYRTIGLVSGYSTIYS